METLQVYHGDCLEVMKEIPDGSVDMIMSDPPYGTTACAWDSIIPLEPMWEHLKRVIKENGAIVLTASQPFTTTLISSNMKMFKYEWVWKKSNPSNIALANKQPMKYHENIIVFCDGQSLYNKEMVVRLSKRVKQAQASNYNFHNSGSEQTGLKYIEVDSNKYDANKKNPSSVLKINSLRPNSKEFVNHPTQKPVALMEYLIKTYTNKGEMVLDFCMGSGTTGVACRNLNRNFIGIEKDPEYFESAKQRINNPNWKPPKKDKEGNQIEEPEGLLPREEVEHLMKIKV